MFPPIITEPHIQSQLEQYLNQIQTHLNIDADGSVPEKKQADTEKKLAALLSKRGLTEEDLPGILSKLQDLSNKKREVGSRILVSSVYYFKY